MQELIDGIHRFQSEGFLPLQQLFERLARGQHPDTLFITCSDSRIDPALLTNSQPGDLFILRNAGNIIPSYAAGKGSGEAATIELAVSGLGVKDIIVCGHSHCGAMRGLLYPETVQALPDFSAWLSHADATRRIVRDHYSHLQGDALLTATIRENVLVQLENLRTLPSVGAGLAKGDLHLHGWVYIIETGVVVAFDVECRQFVKLAEYHVPAVVTSLQHRPDQII